MLSHKQSGDYLLGRSRDRLDKRRNAPNAVARKLSQPLISLLYLTIGLFYVNSIYDERMLLLIKALKWAPLFVLLMALGAYVQRLRALSMAGQGLILLMLATLSANIPGSPDAAISIATLASIASVVIGGWMLAMVLRNVETKRKFFDICGNLGRLVILPAFVMWLFGINLGRGEAGRISAWTDNPNTLALMLAPTIVILTAGIIERKRGWMLWDGIFLIMALLLLRGTGARAAILWVAISLVAFWVARRGASYGVLFALASAVALFGFWGPMKELVLELAHRTQDFNSAFNPRTDFSSGRGEVWRYGIDLFWQNPIFGYGLGSSSGLIAQHDWTWTEFFGGQFHNSYITILVESGVIGFAPFAVIIVLAVLQGVWTAGKLHNVYPNDWPVVALPWAVVCGGLVHGIFETWLMSAGNQVSILFWTCLWMLHLERPKTRSTAHIARV